MVFSKNPQLPLKKTPLSKVGERLRKGGQRSATKKRYFLHYRKGKYLIIDLDLKKKGHRQKY